MQSLHSEMAKLTSLAENLASKKSEKADASKKNPAVKSSVLISKDMDGTILGVGWIVRYWGVGEWFDIRGEGTREGCVRL